MRNEYNRSEDFEADVDGLNDAMQADGNSQPDPSQGDSCGLDLDTHVKAILIALLTSGSGLGCIDTIHALQEIAEAARVKNDFPVYVPHLPEVVDAQLTELAKEARAAFEQFKAERDNRELEYLKNMDTSRMVKQ